MTHDMLIGGDEWIPVATGELPALEHLLGGYYHQDAWEDASTHEEIWQLFAAYEPYTREQLLKEVELLLAHDAKAIRAFLKQHASEVGASTVDDSRAWVERFRSWLSGGHVV